MKKKLLKIFFWCQQLEEESVKQMNTRKWFDTEPRKSILKKHFVSEEENN